MSSMKFGNLVYDISTSGVAGQKPFLVMVIGVGAGSVVAGVSSGGTQTVPRLQWIQVNSLLFNF
jgi:hypothetical protein